MTAFLSSLLSRKFLAMVGIVAVDLGAVLQGHNDPASLGELILATVAVITYIAAQGHVDATQITATAHVAAATVTAAVPAPLPPPVPVTPAAVPPQP